MKDELVEAISSYFNTHSIFKFSNTQIIQTFVSYLKRET